MSRSFTGCKRCKARRQKCDEQRPECGRCQTAGVQCRYAMQLQWGGRAFSRSRFGACVGDGMKKLEYSPGEFVYTTNYNATETGTETSDAMGTTNATGPGTANGTGKGIEVVPARPKMQPDPFWCLTNEQKMLLHHFIHDASQITACHSGMQNDICRMLIPMALQTPSLLHATTALSAIHLQAVNNRSENVKAMPDIARFMALSLEHFRRELQDPASRGSEALLATARTLCLAEIHSGAVHPNSWRAHIEGAKVLMRTIEQNNTSGGGVGGIGDGFRWYLDRWYRSIVSLTALTANGPPIGDHASVEPAEGSPDYLDDYWGFSVHLSAIFREIGAAAWQQRLELEDNNNDNGQRPPLDPGTKPDPASRLELSVRRLMAHTASSTPTFYPGIADGLSSDCVREFMLCNEAFQHSALIQIQRRLRRTPSSSAAVQASVRRILECTTQIGPSSGLSPWVMLTTPLFIAGCEAHGDDREHVRALLSLLHDTIRVPNVLQSLKFLEQYWCEQMEEEDWCHYLDSMSPDSSPPPPDNNAVTLSGRSGPESASTSPPPAAVETPSLLLGDSLSPAPLPPEDQPVVSPIAPGQLDQPVQLRSPSLSAVSASSLVQEADPVPWDLHSSPGPSFSHLQPHPASPNHRDNHQHHNHHHHQRTTSQRTTSQTDETDYGSQFSNDNLHSRLVSEPFIPILLSPASQKTQAMALHPPPNRPPPLRIDSASARKASASSFELKQQQQNPRTPGNKISNFFGWKAPVTSPGAESSSTEISDGGRSPLASPMPPSSLPSGSFAVTPATTIPFDASTKAARNGSLSSSSMLDSKLADLENELREISAELAGSIRREMELEDLVDRLQSELPMDNSNRRTSDYFSDSGTSSIRYPQDAARPEDLDKFRRTAEQERAQLKIELSNKWQEERSKRIATESHIQILENQVSQLRRERVELSELASKNRELENKLEDTRRRLHEEREVKDNFEDLLTAMRVEFEQLRNGTYKSSDPETERLMGEIEALKIENASLAQLQGSRFASIVEETERSPRASGLGLSRSNSRPSRPGSMYGGAIGARDPNSSPQSLADRMNDVEAQRDALHQSLRNLLKRQQLEAREYEKRTRVLEYELARAQETGSPRKLGYQRDVRNLREEVNHLRQRAEDALDQKWQCEKGLSGLKMDLDRAEQETASLRELLQEQAGPTTTDAGRDDGFAEVLATSSSLEEAFKQLQSDREQAQTVDATTDLAASLSRTEALTAHVHSQLQNNSALRQRLADAIGKGEKEQQLSATRINELQAQLKSLEDLLLNAQQQSEEEMAKHEDEIRLLQDTQSDQLQRMVNGGRSPAALSASPFLNSARSPQLDKTTSGDGVPLSEVVQHEVLAKRVRELERMLRKADHEMEEVVGRMNRAQIDVGELQSDRDDALRQTRKLQAEILAERELFRSLLNQ